MGKERTNRSGIPAIAFGVIVGLMVVVAIRAEDATDSFPPLQEWKAAVLSGDSKAVNALYSTNPASSVYANGSNGGSELDTKFWLDQKPQSLLLTLMAIRSVMTFGRSSCCLSRECRWQAL
jgi:hypothetical protein